MKSEYHAMMESLTLSPAARTTIEAGISNPSPQKLPLRSVRIALAVLCLVFLLPVTALGIAQLHKPVELGQQEITETHAGYKVVAEVIPKATEEFSESLQSDLESNTLRQVFHDRTSLESYLGFPLISCPQLEEAQIVDTLDKHLSSGWQLRPQLAVDTSARYILTTTDWEGNLKTADPEILGISAHRVFMNTEIYLDAWIFLKSATLEQMEAGILGENFLPVTGWTTEFLYDEEGYFILDEKGFPVQEHRQFTSTDYTFLPTEYEMANGCTATLVTARFNEPDGTQGLREYMAYFLHEGILYTVRPHAIYDPHLDFPMADTDSRKVLVEVLDSFR